MFLKPKVGQIKPKEISRDTKGSLEQAKGGWEISQLARNSRNKKRGRWFTRECLSSLISDNIFFLEDSMQRSEKKSTAQISLFRIQCGCFKTFKILMSWLKVVVSFLTSSLVSVVALTIVVCFWSCGQEAEGGYALTYGTGASKPGFFSLCITGSLAASLECTQLEARGIIHISTCREQKRKYL